MRHQDAAPRGRGTQQPREQALAVRPSPAGGRARACPPSDAAAARGDGRRPATTPNAVHTMPLATLTSAGSRRPYIRRTARASQGYGTVHPVIYSCRSSCLRFFSNSLQILFLQIHYPALLKRQSPATMLR